MPYTIVQDTTTEAAADAPNPMQPPSNGDEKMEFHIGMYLAADKFGIRRLKTKAQRNGLRRLSVSKEFKDGEPQAETMEKLFGSTLSNDSFRREVVRACLENVWLRNGSTQEVIQRHEPLAWHLGSQYVNRVIDATGHAA
jgi:hypothetical protein